MFVIAFAINDVSEEAIRFLAKDEIIAKRRASTQQTYRSPLHDEVLRASTQAKSYGHRPTIAMACAVDSCSRMCLAMCDEL